MRVKIHVVCSPKASHIHSNHLKTHTTQTMPSSVHAMTTVASTSALPAPWTGSLKAMVADGRLAYVHVVNGKKLYALDRKKLGMPE